MKKNKILNLITIFIIIMYILGNTSTYAAGAMDSKPGVDLTPESTPYAPGQQIQQQNQNKNQNKSQSKTQSNKGKTKTTTSQSQSSTSGLIDPDYYEPASLDNPTGADKIRDIGNTIIGFIQILGSILSVAVLAILGIKYMVGSVEEKAQYKKTMVPYVIGAIMVFGITNILGIASNIFKNLL